MSHSLSIQYVHLFHFLNEHAHCLLFFFFFSSRRRHTRLQGDWSSDVCSSDLFSLEILQKAVRKMILRALPPGILLASRTAVRTDELDPVLLRIAVQSSPSGADRKSVV